MVYWVYNCLNFFTEIEEEMSSIYKIYSKYEDVDFSECCKSIKYPTDKEITEWIKKQKTKAFKTEKANIPLLSK